MSLILGIANGGHDASACLFDDYRLLAAAPLERITRRKSDGGSIPEEAINECCLIAGVARHEVDVIALMRGETPLRYFRKAFSGSYGDLRRRLRAAVTTDPKGARLPLSGVMWRLRTANAEDVLDLDRLRVDGGFRRDAEIHFFDHHKAHAIQPLFHRPDWDDALLYTVDGGGDRLLASARHFTGGRLETLFGGEDGFLDRKAIDLSVAGFYGAATELAGFKINRHEGKLIGLSARGRPAGLDALLQGVRVDPDGQVRTGVSGMRGGRPRVEAALGGLSREDLSASIQRFAEDVTIQAVRNMLARTGARRVGLCGGLFANVLLNQKILEQSGADELFVYPSMSDQGLSHGGVLDYLLRRDGQETWLARRWKIDTLYLGRDYDGAIDRHFEASGFHLASADPVSAAVAAIIAGQAIAIYKGRMEFGPRALGARSVLADPRSATINDSLNQRMERSEFMPFAPYVAEEDADRLFDLPAGARETARFMTITCAVKPEWRERLKAVTHVDGTARPQLIRRQDNPLYYDILKRFEAETGVPALINTSFNVHEEPIINTPQECARALRADRVDGVVTEGGLWRAENPG